MKFRSTWLLLAALAAGCGKRESATDVALPPTVTTKSGVQMVLVPAGSFDMGARGGAEEEGPVHTVTLDAFLMDKYEVKQSEFEKLGRDDDPPFSNLSHFKGPDFPVEQVTWPQAARFCNARSRAEGLKPCYDDNGACVFEAEGYRLPTEAEWEYACRAGTKTDYSFGSEARALGNYAWFADNSAKKTHPVGQKKPNPWGLHDLHGNVAEWCQDAYDTSYYKTSPDTNPRGPEGEKLFVLRGGSWKSNPNALRCAARLGEEAGFSDACLARDAIGFRCVRKAPAETIATAR